MTPAHRQQPCQCSRPCARCREWLIPVRGRDEGKQASKPGEAIRLHGRLAHRAWRSACVQEGGEYLYVCQDCGAWWIEHFWTCVPIAALIQAKIGSAEAWVAAWPRGEVLSTG